MLPLTESANQVQSLTSNGFTFQSFLVFLNHCCYPFPVITRSYSSPGSTKLWYTFVHPLRNVLSKFGADHYVSGTLNSLTFSIRWAKQESGGMPRDLLSSIELSRIASRPRLLKTRPLRILTATCIFLPLERGNFNRAWLIPQEKRHSSEPNLPLFRRIPSTASSAVSWDDCNSSPRARSLLQRYTGPHHPEMITGAKTSLQPIV